MSTQPQKIYRVTFKNLDDGKTYVEDYTNLDHGWDRYQWLLRRVASADKVAWKHVDV